MIKILIIDDSVVIRNRLSIILSELDEVEIVGEAEYALKGFDLITMHKPDFVILDIEMPGLSGMDILTEIKKYVPTPHVAVLTNYPYPSYRERCKELGADYFFDKAFEFNKVRDVVKELTAHAA